MSSPLPIHEQTTQSTSDSADVVDFLERLKTHEPQPRCVLAGPDKRDHVELPPELFGILEQAAHALLDGKNVVITQYDPFLTTQEAADYLGVSRSTVVRIVERGELPFTKVSRHRRIRFTDLQAFIEQEKERQINAIAATASSVDDEDVSYDEHKEIRAEVAKQRRSRESGM